MNPLTRSLTLPRMLHPAAWWLWAIGLATAASRTTNVFSPPAGINFPRE